MSMSVVCTTMSMPMTLMVVEVGVLRLEVWVICLDLKCANASLGAMVVDVIIPTAIVTITTARIADINLLWRIHNNMNFVGPTYQ